MATEREISIDMTTDELLVSAAPNPGGVPAAWLTSSPHVARELLAWAEAGVASSVRPTKSKFFRSAARQVRVGLSKVGEGPAPS